MEKWYEKIAPALYAYAIAISIIVVGSVHFIAESDYVRGEVVTKKVVEVGENRTAYTNTPIREFFTLYSGKYKDGNGLEGTAITLRDGTTGETDTIHVPIGLSGQDFLNQDNDNAIFYPYVYAGDLAEGDIAKRYLLVVDQGIGGEVVIAVGRYQYEYISEGTFVTIRGERVVRRRF